jgi:hypothetical protein
MPKKAYLGHLDAMFHPDQYRGQFPSTARTVPSEARRGPARTSENRSTNNGRAPKNLRAGFAPPAPPPHSHRPAALPVRGPSKVALSARPSALAGPHQGPLQGGHTLPVPQGRAPPGFLARCGHGGAVAIACHRAALRGRSPTCNCSSPGPSRTHRPSAPRPSRGSPPACSVIRWPRFPSAQSVACPRRSLAPLALEPPARAARLRRPR